MASAYARLHSTLVVANRTAATPVLLQEIERRAAMRPTAFVLLIPDVTSRATADWALNEALKEMGKAARGPTGVRDAHVKGVLGGSDAFESIRKTLTEGDFDDVIISTLTKRSSKWLRRGLPHRVEQLGVPVSVITPPPEKRMGLQDIGMAPGPS